MMTNPKRMTKADLIKAIADMPDDATIDLSTRRNGIIITSINVNKHKNFISIELDYSDDDDDLDM